MILNNLAHIIYAGMTGNTTPSSTMIDGTTAFTYYAAPFIGGSSATFTYAGGNVCTTASSSSASDKFSNAARYVYFSLTFGSGTTEPTAEDYQMESPYDTTSHFSWGSISQNYVSDNYTKVIVGTIANISEEDLIVSEIGVVIATIYGTGNHLLIARSLITPVTIAPNETKTFQYTLDLSGIAG